MLSGQMQSVWSTRRAGPRCKRVGRVFLAGWAIAWIATALAPCSEAFAAAESVGHPGHGLALAEHGDGHAGHSGLSDRHRSHCPQITDLDAIQPNLALADVDRLDPPALMPRTDPPVARRLRAQGLANYHPPPAVARLYLRTLRLLI